MPILNLPLRFWFYISEKTSKDIIMKNNFVKYLVPVKAWLTCASYNKIMVYLFLVVEKHITFFKSASLLVFESSEL